MSSVMHSSVPLAAIPLVIPKQAVVPRRPLHRLRAVRRSENISHQQLAKRLRINVKTVMRQENQFCDLTLSELYQWQEALGVPLAELFLEPGLELSRKTLTQGRMVRLMKTALAILGGLSRARTKRIAQNLVNQLLEIMPELKDVTAWPREGTRRPHRELGRAAQQMLLPDSHRDFND